MRRIIQLDGIRALAFLSVFLNHAYRTPMLWAGVDIFFVLSGFLITSILLDAQGKRGAWSHFYERRALRILPPYVIFLLAATFLFRLHWGGDILWYGLFAMNIAEALGVGVPGLGILWSLAVEEQFYLFWPFVALRLTSPRVLGVAFAVVLVSPLLRGIFTPLFSTHWPIYYLMPFRMDLLAAGAMLAVLWREKRALRVWRLWGISAIALSCGLFGILAWGDVDFRAGSNSILFNSLGYSLICCIAAGLLAFALGTERGIWFRLMTAPAVRWIGTVSYTAYLVHAAALGLISPLASHTANVALALGVVLAYSSLSWLLIERPILMLRPSAWLKASPQSGN
jgi:peptidoglycan/LPS O-acetylase OafA/YrhL